MRGIRQALPGIRRPVAIPESGAMTVAREPKIVSRLRIVRPDVGLVAFEKRGTIFGHFRAALWSDVRFVVVVVQRIAPIFAGVIRARKKRALHVGGKEQIETFRHERRKPGTQNASGLGEYLLMPLVAFYVLPIMFSLRLFRLLTEPLPVFGRRFAAALHDTRKLGQVLTSDG